MKSEYMVTSVSVETETQEEIINPAKQFRGFKGVWIPREIWLNTDLSVLEKVVIAEVDSLDGNRGCFASNKYMSIFLGISESRAAHLMADLIKREYIESYGFNGRFRKLRLGKTAMLKTAELDSQKQHIGHAENSIHITKVIEKDIKKKEDESGSKDPSSLLPPQEEKKDKEEEYNAQWASAAESTWNSLAPSELVKIRTMTRKRVLGLSRRVLEGMKLDEVLLKASKSDFLRGKNDRGWKMDFDWLISNDTNWVKVMEGKYDNKSAPDDQFQEMKRKQMEIYK